MSDGLITRIGKWIDRTWQSKATENDLQELNHLLMTRMSNVELMVTKLELPDLKTRIEKLELYTGMTRKVDPTRAPVAKSAFSM